MPDRRTLPSVRLAAVVVTLVLVGAGCAGPIAPPASTASASGSGEPSPVPASTSADATAPSEPAEPPLEEPPAVVLALPDGEVAGNLGTFSWGGGVSDAPWLRGAGPVTAPRGATLTARVDGDAEVGRWRARYLDVEADGQGGTPSLLAEGTGPAIAFPAPPAGSWSIQLEVDYPERGGGAYYWAIDVG